MRHRTGRSQRWWTGGFTLLGLAICACLPIGVLGTLDVSFTRSVAVPHQRPVGHLQLRSAPHLVGQLAEHHLTLPIRTRPPSPVPALASVLAPGGPFAVGLLAALVVLFTLGTPAASLPARTPLLARPPSRGPPRSC